MSLYKKITFGIKKLRKMLSCLEKNLVSCNPNRNYLRIRIKPIGKWYYCTKYDNTNN